MDAIPSVEALDRFRSDLSVLADIQSIRLGLAVSGGPDSLALLLLARAALPGSVMTATVDHGLRAESAAEARYVASLCGRLAVPHEVLRPAAPIKGNLQSGAREARYAALEDWRCRHRLDWIATAHHADDQAETVLMRLNRGSGLGGLASVRAVNGKVVRPLLAWRRAELAAIVARAGIAPVNDPSNRDDRFDRVRVRRWLGQSSGIDPTGLARSARALAEAEAAIEWMMDRLWVERACESEDHLQLDVSALPAELRRRLVERGLKLLAPDAGPRGEELVRFIAALQRGQTATLAGVKGSGGAVWRFSLAPPRRG